MSIKTYIQISDPRTGKKGRKRRCRSFVIAFPAMIEAGGHNASTTTQYYDTSHSLAYFGKGPCNIEAPATNTTYGIVVGTGSNAVTVTDYALQTLILHGSTSGKLSYGLCAQTEAGSVGSTASWTITRTVTNNSGADITVNEVGIYVYNQGTSNYSMIERTLSTFTVANGGSKTITYTISVSV